MYSFNPFPHLSPVPMLPCFPYCWAISTNATQVQASCTWCLASRCCEKQRLWILPLPLSMLYVWLHQKNWRKKQIDSVHIQQHASCIYHGCRDKTISRIQCHTATIHTRYQHTPLTPLRSLSSMNKDRYSGDLVFKLMKYSKSDDIICLNSLSLLKDSCRKWSKRSFRSSRLCSNIHTSEIKHIV